MANNLTILNRLGFNERVLTADDFDRICAECGIFVSEQAIKWQGYFTVCGGVPSIVLNGALRGVDRMIVAFHETGHYLLHAPGMVYFCNGTVSKTEYEAECFAARALIPLPLLMSKSLTEIQEEFGYPTEFLKFRQRVFEQVGS
jgi:Zn-dependent peptidase ImmA (M78 family)